MAISHDLLWGALLAAATWAAYLPALQAGFIWDDDEYVLENRTLRDWSGLRDIWFRPEALPQYYPLVHTTFWIEQRLWGLAPLGYHLVNVAIHAANALLVWRILMRLGTPGAYLVAFLFALHPVHVESVAWVTERKNVLSGLFYLLALRSYLCFRPLGPAPTQAAGAARYAAALALYLAALLCKTVTCTLPAALLLLTWWRRGKIGWRDAAPLAPMFLCGALFGLTTAWLERTHVGALGAEFAFTPVERLLIAGRAVWFYALKLVFPWPLIFIYPRWRIDATAWPQYLWPLGALLALGLLWGLRRRWGRGPLTAALFFVGTLFPALGFLNFYPMLYSFVADHFQYLASLGVLTLLGSGLATLVQKRRWFHGAEYLALALGVPTVLGALTFEQCLIYHSADALWRDTLAKNPECWMAHNNLGVAYGLSGNHRAAVEHFDEVLRLHPRDSQAHTNLGNILTLQGRLDEAFDHYEQALKGNPSEQNAHYNLANILVKRSQFEQAQGHYQAALRIKPYFADAHYAWARMLVQQDRLDQAAREAAEAVRHDPNFVDAHALYGEVLTRLGRLDEALAQWTEVQRLQPAHPFARQRLQAIRDQIASGKSSGGAMP